MIKLQPGKFFFDSREVITRVDRTTRQVLSKFGRYVRADARQSIRKRKKASAPGKPPSSHTGLLKRFIFFAYDLNSRSVVIGPERLPGSGYGEAPSILEYGGGLRGVKNTRRRKRRVGGSGEVLLDGRRGSTTKSTEDWKGRQRRVTYAKLLTPAQAARANRLNEEMYGPEVIPVVRIEQRPYMGPAFQKQLPGLPKMWQDSVKA